MKYKMTCAVVSAATLIALCGLTGIPSRAGNGGENTFANPSGFAATITRNNVPIDTTNPFFQDLGSNGRRCVTCHQPSEGWSISVTGIRKRFSESKGMDPIFRTNDGANSPKADVSTFQARRKAYSMLLTRGVLRIGIAIPANAEFELIDMDDPYGYASTNELSLFRRPLPSTNLSFLTAIMWDGREASLQDQANDATLGHAQAAVPLTDEQRQRIVDFETNLFTAQTLDWEAGRLNAQGAEGGPEYLRDQTFYTGINDLLGDSQTGAAFNNISMTLFESWEHLKRPDEHSRARRSIARGQALFNSKVIDITGVRGVNDNPAFGSPAVVHGTCTTCHDAPNIGHHSVKLPLDLGLTDESRRTPDMPLYTLRNKATGETIRTTDPGRALISGKWADIGKFKGPILRGLAARAPYFHNGSAADLNEVLDFYSSRFGVSFTRQERKDLIAFLNSL